VTAFSSPAAIDQERNYRWSRARQFMEENDLDALLIFGSDRSDRYDAGQYLTFDRRYQHLIFPREGEPVMIAFAAQVATQNMVARERGHESWIADIRTGAVTQLGPQVIKEKGLARGRIGVIGAGWGGPFFRYGWVPKDAWEAVQAGLPDATLVPVTQEYGLVMAQKSKADLAHLRRASEAGDVAIRAMMDVARPGASETEIYAAGYAAQLKLGMRVTWMLFQTGYENPSWGEPTWLIRGHAPRVLQADDMVGAEIFPNFAELNTHVNMSFTLGKVPDQTRRCHDIARESYEIGLSMLRPGASFREIFEAMEEPTRRNGAWHLTPQIAALNPLLGGGPSADGIRDQLPDMAAKYPFVEGGERMPFDYEISEGMSFSLQPDCRFGRHWSLIGSVVAVTADGAQAYNTLSTKMNHIG
jgi:Xaa-Pro dipeptidase